MKGTLGLSNKGKKGSLGISKEQEMTVKEKHCVGAVVVPTTRGTYVDKEGEALHKRKGTMDLAIFDELLERRQKLDYLIQ